MSKAKQNSFLTGYFAVLAVGAAGLGYLAFSAASGASDASDKYTQSKSQLDKLQKAKVFPKQENVDAKKKQIAAFTDEVIKLNDDLRKYQPALEDGMQPSAFQSKLVKLRDGLTTDAKNQGVKLPDGFDFGMGSYLSSFPETEAVPQLSAWLDGINNALTTVVKAGVKEINFIQRPELPFEKKGAAAEIAAAKAKAAAAATKKPTPAPKGAAKTAVKEEPVVLAETEVLERYPVRLTFTGSSRAVNAALTALSNTKPGSFFYDFRVIRAENEQKKGADSTAKVETKEETDPVNGQPFKRDSVYIFGREMISVYVDLDILRFPEPAVPATPKK